MSNAQLIYYLIMTLIISALTIISFVIFKTPFVMVAAVILLFYFMVFQEKYCPYL